jgi:flagellar biosynthesis protein FlhB
MIFFLLFLMLYCSMINVRCVFIIFRSACLSSSCYLRSVVSNVHAISFQKIYIEESSMRCWHFDCWSSAKRWRCVDVLLTKKLLFFIFVMMIVCLIIFVLCNCWFSSTWSLYLKMTKILSLKRMIRSQQFEQFVRNFFSFFHQRSDVFSMQMRCYSFVLFLNAELIWRITCHLICSSSRFLSCIEIIKQNDLHRN